MSATGVYQLWCICIDRFLKGPSVIGTFQKGKSGLATVPSIDYHYSRTSFLRNCLARTTYCSKTDISPGVSTYCLCWQTFWILIWFRGSHRLMSVHDFECLLLRKNTIQNDDRIYFIHGVKCVYDSYDNIFRTPVMSAPNNSKKSIFSSLSLGSHEQF